MVKLCFDYGHGGNDSGACYKERKEKDDVLKLGLAIGKELRSHGIVIGETRTTDVTLGLKDRSDFEKRKNMTILYLSIEMLLNQNRLMG